MYEYNANVLRVYDGDTIRVDLDLGFGIWLRNQSIRFTDINTPEIHGDSKEAGIASRDRLRELLSQADNKCVIKTVKDKQRGKWGRILGEVWVDDKDISLNEILLNEGLAVKYI